MREKIIGTEFWKLESSGHPRKINPESAVGESEMQPKLYHRMPQSLSIVCLSSQNVANELITSKQGKINSPRK